MTRRTTPWPAGVPCWLDLDSPDVAASRAFYGALFGWTFEESSPEYGGYVVCQLDGASTAGIAPQMEGAPTAWTLYFASDDADSTARAVAEHGGTVVMEPMDVGPQGRMFVAIDPTGAPFGVWQAGEHTGTQVVGEPGGLSWQDLRSNDPDAARTFYGAVFGLAFQPLPEADPSYSTFARPGDPMPLGGVGGMFGHDSIPSHWLVYFGVADVDAALVTAAAVGGSVLSPAFDTPYGRMAALADPGGAPFWIVTPFAQS